MAVDVSSGHRRFDVESRKAIQTSANAHKTMTAEEISADTAAQPGRSQRENARNRSIGSIALAVLSLSLAVFAEAAVLTTRARFAQFFADMEVESSPMTRIALGPAIPLFLAAVIVVMIANEVLASSSKKRDLGNAAVTFLAAACVAIYVVGTFAPLLSIIEGLSS